MRAAILVVDDDVALLEMIREALSGADFEVETAQSARDAIAALTKRKFEVVVTDLVLDPLATRQSSVDLIEHLKRTLPSVSVIVLSGFASSFKNQLAELRVPVLEKGLNTAQELEYLITRMVRQHPRPVPPEVIGYRLDDIRRIFKEELARLEPLQERTIVLANDVHIRLPKPLRGFKAEIEQQLRKCAYEENVFLMMKFRPHTRDLAEFITSVLEEHGLRGIRADDEGWNLTGNVYNPVAVLHCCKYGIALFDDVAETEAYSANVAYELGMMHQQNKACLILRHANLPPVPFDLLKDLYVTYDRDLRLKPIIKRWVGELHTRSE